MDKMDLTSDEMIDLIAQLELEGEKDPVVYIMDPHKFEEIQVLVRACWHLTHTKNVFDDELAISEVADALKLFPDWMKDPDWSIDDE